jgi:nucleoside-diphosphate-sugar epimerase
MRLFITGATGFIGSHVMAAALAAGHHVVAMRRNPQSTSVVPLPCQPEWFEGDIASLSASQLEGVDVVMHLAAVGVSPKIASWHELLQTNVGCSLRLLELMKDSGVTRCVVSGTCHEYGNSALRYSAIPPDAPLDPLNAYGASKAAAFHMIRGFAIKECLELFYGRIFTAYGEGQYSENFWPSLKRAALSGNDFPMTSGKQISDFIPVALAADYLLTACHRPDITPGIPLVANIGTGQPKSLFAFAETEWERLEATGRLIPCSLQDRPDQIDHMVADTQGLSISLSTLA